MPQFITLTGSQDVPVTVNLAHIQHFSAHHGNRGTVIKVGPGDGYLVVKEPYDRVLRVLVAFSEAQVLSAIQPQEAGV